VTLRSILLGTAGLGVAALAALVLTLVRGGPSAGRAELRAAARLAALVVLVQAAHFGEELVTGFQRHFPEALGLAPWPAAFFVPFNLFWLAVWALACRRLAAGSRLALLVLWFLGLAAVANGVAHPLLAARAGGYFPGLVTAPLLGVAGLLLLRRLASVTRSPAGGSA
jgi:hypothetical protein